MPIRFPQVTNKYYEAMNAGLPNEYCISPDAFGSMDGNLQIPEKLLVIMENLMANLEKSSMEHPKDAKWMDIISKAMQGGAPSTEEMSIILDGDLKKLQTDQMIWTLALYFRLNTTCDGQGDLAYRFQNDALAILCKYSFFTLICHNRDYYKSYIPYC